MEEYTKQNNSFCIQAEDDNIDFSEYDIHDCISLQMEFNYQDTSCTLIKSISVDTARALAKDILERCDEISPERLWCKLPIQVRELGRKMGISTETKQDEFAEAYFSSAQ